MAVSVLCLPATPACFTVPHLPGTAPLWPTSPQHICVLTAMAAVLPMTCQAAAGYSTYGTAHYGKPYKAHKPYKKYKGGKWKSMFKRSKFKAGKWK